MDAIQMLVHCERILSEHANGIAPGFIVRHWSELAQQFIELGYFHAAIRQIDCGLDVDSDSTELKRLRREVESRVQTDETQLIGNSFERLTKIITQDSTPKATLETLIEGLEAADLVRLRAPLTYGNLVELFTSALGGGGEFDAEEKADQVSNFGRAELPQVALEALSVLVMWVVKVFTVEQPGNPIDIDLYDDLLWPRSYESQACTLLVVHSASHDACEASVFEELTGKCLWRGSIEQGQVQYERWVFEQEDGFIPDEPVDIPLLIRVSNPPGCPEFRLSVSASVAAHEAVWPDYPTGALDPKDVQGGELYGRGVFIKRIVSALGNMRAQATYLIEGVRQMGKTSLLKFIRRNAPKHVLPIYVNLEAIQSDPEKNVWNIIIEQILRDDEVALWIEQPEGRVKGQTHGDVVRLAKELCRRCGKAYVLLLLDELHVLLRECDSVKGVLADLRTDLNEVANRISVILADRYTLHESERKVESEYWLQLTPLPLAPLDQASTASAIEVPCQGTDIKFVRGAIERVYYWTSGYPFHVQRLVQNVLAGNLEGPWVTVVPSDIDAAVPSLISQDRLFQEGLCRQDRMDAILQAAVAAVLEWSDLMELFPALSEEPEWRKVLAEWQPHPSELIAGLGEAGDILDRLVSVGVMRREDRTVKFFSPLLERWLHRMRNEGKSLIGGKSAGNWGLSPDEEVAGLDSGTWMHLDAELASRCQKAGVAAPLKMKVAHPETWSTLSRTVTNRDEFQLFLNVAHELLIDGREEKRGMLRYPWLMLGYHRLRLVRNVFVHGARPSAVAISAWDQTYFRAIGRPREGSEPNGSDEWRAVQLVLLRGFHIGYRNAIAIAGEVKKRSVGAI
jgi:hypothetical protein